MSDILAELGLTGDDATTTIATTTIATTEAKADTPAVTDGAGAGEQATPEGEAKEKVVRKAISINATSTGIAALLPPQQRGGGFGGPRESKYPFDDLTAPTAEGYSFFTVKLADTDADEKSLKSAVQSAVSAQNKKHKDAGEDTKYVTRTVVENGAFTAITVYRVDATLGDEE